ncbi:MAG: hypothetical protein NT141_00005 [candidate division WWE3 bacterium]|nr:hypothetical protein [candidate division WWE3 bacterium]
MKTQSTFLAALLSLIVIVSVINGVNAASVNPKQICPDNGVQVMVSGFIRITIPAYYQPNIKNSPMTVYFWEIMTITTGGDFSEYRCNTHLAWVKWHL